MNEKTTSLHNVAARIESAVKRIKPSLDGLCVLTEAASGPFVATASIAALSGARKVIACTRDSRFGSAREVRDLTLALAGLLNVDHCIEVSERQPFEAAEDADIVTNLGFVRPVSRDIVRRLPNHAAIALMWEPWEFRKEDVDIKACREFGIPIIATNERHPNVATFRAVGMLSLKLLLERDVEVTGLNLLVIGSDPFGSACKEVLTSVGAFVTKLDPTYSWSSEDACVALNHADAVVIVEHRFRGEILGPSVTPVLDGLKDRRAPIIHICGLVDNHFLESHGIEKYPQHSVPLGYMTVTTAYVGVKPVVDLHTAGLHVAAIVCRARKSGASIDAAVDEAVSSGYGLRLTD